jgi:cytochrome c2
MVRAVLPIALVVAVAFAPVCARAESRLSLKSVSVDLPPGDDMFPDGPGADAINNNCLACHSNKPGENKFGPSLAGVFGRKSGTEPGYNYSSAMKGLNVTWDEANLDQYLQGPGKFVRGTKMVYFVPNEKDRQALSRI